MCVFAFPFENLLKHVTIQNELKNKYYVLFVNVIIGQMYFCNNKPCLEFFFFLVTMGLKNPKEK